MKKTLFFVLLLFFIFPPITTWGKTQNIETTGIAIVIPGELAKQFFYIIDGKNLWQIYSYRSNFPLIKKGDILIVRGEKSQSRGISRIKIKEKNQIKIIGHNNIPSTEKINTSQIKENSGKLISIEGEIKQKDDNYLLSDSSGEIDLINGKSSRLQVKETNKVLLTGVPFYFGNQSYLLVLSAKQNQTEKQKEETKEIAPDLERPKNDFYLAKIGMFFIIMYGSSIFFKKIKKRKNLFDD